jgi:hypothetical protein
VHRGHHIKCPSLLPEFKKTAMFRHVFVDLHNATFHENPFIGSLVVSCAETGKRPDEAILVGSGRDVKALKKA